MFCLIFFFEGLTYLFFERACSVVEHFRCLIYTESVLVCVCGFPAFLVELAFRLFHNDLNLRVGCLLFWELGGFEFLNGFGGSFWTRVIMRKFKVLVFVAQWCWDLYFFFEMSSLNKKWLATTRDEYHSVCLKKRLAAVIPFRRSGALSGWSFGIRKAMLLLIAKWPGGTWSVWAWDGIGPGVPGRPMRGGDQATEDQWLVSPIALVILKN